MGYHRGAPRLLRSPTVRDRVPRVVHGPDCPPALVMDSGPLQADHLPSTALMGPRHRQVGAGPQGLRLPAGLQHRFRHGPTAARRVWLPPLQRMAALPRFMRPAEPARHIPTDRVTAIRPATHLTRGGQTATDRLGYTKKRHPGGRPVAAERLLLASGAYASGLAGTCPSPPSAAARRSRIVSTTAIISRRLRDWPTPNHPTRRHIR
jgi:hypothetical protein